MDHVFASIPAASNEWAIYILGALTVVYIIFRPMLRRKKDPLDRLPPLSLTQQKSVERDMQNLLVELSTMARQITAQLDTRSAKLEALIEEADRKLAQLDQKLTDQAKSENDAALTPAPDRQAAPPAEPPVPDFDDSPPDRYAEIHTLADQGHSVHEIAQRLGRPQGEVELILALRAR